MKDKTPTLSIYQTVPNEAHQQWGLLQLLLHFRWTWTGVLAGDDENGERFLQAVLPTFSQQGVCFAFIERVPPMTFVSVMDDMLDQLYEIYDAVMGSTANVVVCYGDILFTIALRWVLYLPEFVDVDIKPHGKVWVLTAQVDLISWGFQRTWDIEMFSGAIALAVHSKEVLGFQNFLQLRNPSSEREDGFIQEFWKRAFNCLFLISELDQNLVDICSGEEKLESLPGTVFDMSMSGHSYSIYNAAYIVAHTLHALHSSKSRRTVKGDGFRWQLKDQDTLEVMFSSD